jgi:hypothetical protein
MKTPLRRLSTEMIDASVDANTAHVYSKGAVMKTTGIGSAISILALLVVGCASNSQWFHVGPRPAELVGIWIDEKRTTATDTVALVLGVGGDARTLHLRVLRDSASGTRIERHDQRNGLWYISGTLTDTTGRAICFQQRVRTGATCRQFRLDTLSGPSARRQLTVLGYPGEYHVLARVLMERVPQ